MSSLAFKGKSRQFVTKLHRWSGLTLLLFLFIAALTGAALSFRWELDAWINPDLFQVTPAATVMSQAGIIQRVEARFPDAVVSSITFPKEAGQSLRIALKSKMDAHVAHKHVPGMKATVTYNQVFVDPHTGAILGQRNTSEFVISKVNLIPFLLRLHYTLFLEKWGVWIMGGCALVWFVTSFFGLALSWPRAWRSLKSWRSVVSIRQSQGGYKFNYDLHRSASLLTLPVLIVVAFTSVYLNLPDVVKPAVQWFSPITSAMAVPKVGKVDLDQPVLAVEDAARIAGEILPGGRVNSVSRDFIKGVYSVRVQLPTDVSPSGNNTVYVSMADGAPVLVRRAAERTGADTFVAWQLPLHSGLAFGLFGQVLVCVSAVALLAMCVTGFYVWLRKHRGEKQLAARRRGRVAQATDEAVRDRDPSAISA